MTREFFVITRIPNHILFLNILFMAVFLMASLMVSPSYAQDSKPKLVEIVLNEQTSDPEALRIVERLDPAFFEVEDGFEEGDFYASYLRLDPRNPKRFLAVTAQNTSYYCTSYGCPYYIYASSGGNKWSLVLSLQAHAVYFDVNSSKNSSANIISTSIEQAKKSVKIWLWDGLKYTEAKR